MLPKFMTLWQVSFGFLPPPPVSPSTKFTLEFQYIYTRCEALLYFCSYFQWRFYHCTNGIFRSAKTFAPFASASAIHLLFSLRLEISIFTQAFNISQRWDVERAHPYRLWIMRFALHHRTQHTHIHSCRRKQPTSNGKVSVLCSSNNFKSFLPSSGFILRSIRLVWHLFCCEFMLRLSLPCIFIYVNIEMARANTRNNLVECCTRQKMSTRQENGKKHCRRNAFSITFPIRDISKCNIHVRNIFPPIFPHQNCEQAWRVSIGSIFTAHAAFVQSHCGVALNTEHLLFFHLLEKNILHSFHTLLLSARTQCSVVVQRVCSIRWAETKEKRRKLEYHQQQKL